MQIRSPGDQIATGVPSAILDNSIDCFAFWLSMRSDYRIVDFWTPDYPIVFIF